MKKVSITDIARKIGCSAASVSRALNNQPKVRDDIRSKILKTAQELGYNAGFARRPVTYAVFYTAAGLASPYVSTLLQTLVVEAERRGIHCMLLDAESFSLLQDYMIDGILSIDYSLHLAMKLPNRMAVPIVCINDYNAPLSGVCTVVSNELQGVEMAVRHLVERGHRKIALLRTQSNANLCGDLRQGAYEKIMAGFGLFPCAELLDTEQMKRIDYLNNYLCQGITAFLITGEGMYSHIVHSLLLLGKKIPQDISVIGWETDPVWMAANFIPQITTVGQNLPELTANALNILEDSRNGKPVKSVQTDYLFHDRGSVAFLSGEKESSVRADDPGTNHAFPSSLQQS